MDIDDYIELTFFIQKQHDELVDIMTMQHIKMLNTTTEYSKQVHFSYIIDLLGVSIMYFCLNNIFMIYYMKRNEQDDTEQTEEVIYHMKPNSDDQIESEESNSDDQIESEESKNIVPKNISLLCI